MFNIILERLRQGKRTVPYPKALPSLPPKFRGRPFIHEDRCVRPDGTRCTACREVCPSGALLLDESRPDSPPCIDLGKCTFCGLCAKACQGKAIVFTGDWRLASSSREALIIKADCLDNIEEVQKAKLAAESKGKELTENELYLALPVLPVEPAPALRNMFKKSLRFRQVSAAGCNACEADLNVLTTVVFDIARFGLDFVASPRHADAICLTGPVPHNMQEALEKCSRAMPEPKLVFAVGACAISGGLFAQRKDKKHNVNAEGASPHLEVDLYIPGCPPHPYTNLDGFLRFLGIKV